MKQAHRALEDLGLLFQKQIEKPVTFEGSAIGATSIATKRLAMGYKLSPGKAAARAADSKTQIKQRAQMELDIPIELLQLTGNYACQPWHDRFFIVIASNEIRWATVG